MVAGGWNRLRVLLRPLTQQALKPPALKLARLSQRRHRRFGRIITSIPDTQTEGNHVCRSPKGGSKPLARLTLRSSDAGAPSWKRSAQKGAENRLFAQETKRARALRAEDPCSPSRSASASRGGAAEDAQLVAGQQRAASGSSAEAEQIRRIQEQRAKGRALME